jgi:hypothetical protein
MAQDSANLCIKDAKDRATLVEREALERCPDQRRRIP